MPAPLLSGNSEGVEGGETRAPPVPRFVPVFRVLAGRGPPLADPEGGYIGVSVSTSSLVAHSLTWHGTDIALVEVGVLC